MISRLSILLKVLQYFLTTQNSVYLLLNAYKSSNLLFNESIVWMRIASIWSGFANFKQNQVNRRMKQRITLIPRYSLILIRTKHACTSTSSLTDKLIHLKCKYLVYSKKIKRLVILSKQNIICLLSFVHVIRYLAEVSRPSTRRDF